MFGFRSDPASKLRVLMAELDVTVGELADRAQVSRATISALRSGRRKPNPDTAYLIARALGVRTSMIWPDR